MIMIRFQYHNKGLSIKMMMLILLRLMMMMKMMNMMKMMILLMKHLNLMLIQYMDKW